MYQQYDEESANLVQLKLKTSWASNAVITVLKRALNTKVYKFYLNSKSNVKQIQVKTLMYQTQIGSFSLK